jgi:regulator of CtrA degradation
MKGELTWTGELAYDVDNYSGLRALLCGKSPTIGLLQKRRVMVQTPFFSDDKTVSFGEKLAASEQFLVLFREGMDLVSRAASYLDGDGREEAKLLERSAAVAYAVESMRLTTRLMQVASWLLLQRAVNEGELSRAEAAAEKRRVPLSQQGIVSNKEVLARLPLRLRDLIGISLRLQARVIHLDLLIYKSRDARGKESLPPSPVKTQIERLRSALAAPRGPSPTN